MAKRKMTPTPAENITRQIMEAYQPKDAQEIQDAVKQIFAPIFEAALKGEMDNHLGYSSHECSEATYNSRNGYSEKTLMSPPSRTSTDSRSHMSRSPTSQTAS